MLKMLRFQPVCFLLADKPDLKVIQAILLRCSRQDKRVIAFEDLSIVEI